MILPNPTDSDPDKMSEDTFVVQMAPLDAVPHAVHFFLEQVAHGLWNGCYLYLNGPHVLQVGPQYYEEDEEISAKTEEETEEEEEDPRGPVLKKFREKRLEQLAFPDYSETYPHEAWTLGFAGRYVHLFTSLLAIRRIMTLRYSCPALVTDLEVPIFTLIKLTMSRHMVPVVNFNMS